jgi:hypothetical protein
MTLASLEGRRERDALCEAAAQWACCHPGDLIGGGTRSPDLRQARQAVCWELVRRGLAAAEVGRLLKLDHTTVLHAVRRVDELVKAQHLWMEGLLAALDAVPLGIRAHVLELDGRLVPIRETSRGSRQWRIITRGMA